MSLAAAILVLLALPAPAEPPESFGLEGMRPGQTFGELDGRFELRHQVAFDLPPDRRYVLEATRPLPDRARRELEARGIDRLELVFRDERLRSVRVAYAGRASTMFGDMAGELEAEHGEPSSVVERGPMQVGRAHGIRLYLWLKIWTWEVDGLTLTVEGKHYGVDKVHEHPEDHEYVFTLARDGR